MCYNIHFTAGLSCRCLITIFANVQLAHGKSDKAGCISTAFHVSGAVCAGMEDPKCRLKEAKVNSEDSFVAEYQIYQN